MLGVLYDIHGNLPALEAVLAEADELGVDRWLLGGDYGTPSPWPLQTLARLKELEPATWIRGNGERWLREPPADRPEVMESYELFTGGLPEDVVDWLYNLPAQAELDGVLYVHGSPLSDVESFAPDPEEDEARLLAGVRDRLIVFGHSHQQFRRPDRARLGLAQRRVERDLDVPLQSLRDRAVLLRGFGCLEEGDAVDAVDLAADGQPDRG